MQQSDTDGSDSLIEPAPHSPSVPPPASSRHRPLRVGYALNPKKSRLFDARGLFTQPSPPAAQRTPRPTFTALHVSRPLHAQGPFDVLLVKLTDAMARALFDGDEEARGLVERMETYGRQSGCVMIDDFQLVRRVLDRRRISELLNAADITVAGYPVRAPAAVNVELPIAEPISLPFFCPVICKPVQSCGSVSSHTFYILYSVEQLHSLAATGSYIVQQLLPHSGTMYKVYVINAHAFVIPKPSIPPHVTTPPHSPPHPLTLDSQSMALTPLTANPTTTAANAQQTGQAVLSETVVNGGSVVDGMVDVLCGVAVRLSAVFGLTLYGFDVVESGGVLYVVDVNYFPSYNRVEGLSDKLAAAIQDKYDREVAAKQRRHTEQRKEGESEDAKRNGHLAREHDQST